MLLYLTRVLIANRWTLSDFWQASTIETFSITWHDSVWQLIPFLFEWFECELHFYKNIRQQNTELCCEVGVVNFFQVGFVLSELGLKLLKLNTSRSEQQSQYEWIYRIPTRSVTMHAEVHSKDTWLINESLIKVVLVIIRQMANVTRE